MRGETINTPMSSQDHVEQLEDAASPVLSFLREYCEVGPEKEECVDDIYEAYKEFCERVNQFPSSKNIFCRDFYAALPSSSNVRKRKDGLLKTFMKGVALASRRPSEQIDTPRGVFKVTSKPDSSVIAGKTVTK